MTPLVSDTFGSQYLDMTALTYELDDLFIGKPSKTVLQKALSGMCVEAHVKYLSSVLFNHETARFSEFTDEEQHASVLLLLWYAQKTNNSNYLELLLWTLPYCMQCLDTFYSSRLHDALSKSGSLCESVLVEEINDFLHKQGDEVLLVQGFEKFKTFVTLLPVKQSLEVSAEMLSDWYCVELPNSAVLAEAMRFSVDLLSNCNSEELDKEELTCELLKEFFNKTGAGKYCLSVLVSLFSNCKKESEVKPWLETMTPGPVLDLFVNLVQHFSFPHEFRDQLIKHFLRDNSTIESLKIAKCLESVLTSRQVIMLNNSLAAKSNLLSLVPQTLEAPIKEALVEDRECPEPIRKIKEQ